LVQKIRIAYTDFSNIDTIITTCINDSLPQSRLYLSDSEEYKWLLEGIIPFVK